MHRVYHGFPNFAKVFLWQVVSMIVVLGRWVYLVECILRNEYPDASWQYLNFISIRNADSHCIFINPTAFSRRLHLRVCTLLIFTGETEGATNSSKESKFSENTTDAGGVQDQIGGVAGGKDNRIRAVLVWCCCERPLLSDMNLELIT